MASYDYDISFDDVDDVDEKALCIPTSESKARDQMGNFTIIGSPGPPEPTWMTAFAIHPISLESPISPHFNITTKFKNDTACKGVAFTQTCELHQGLVDYSIILTNDSISLRYPHWQNDTFLSGLSDSIRAPAELWNRVFINLYKPIRFDYSRTYCNGTLGWAKVYTKCDREFELYGEMDFNMSCVYDIDNSIMTIRDNMNFEIENVGKVCGKTWRNPMQVICDCSSRCS